MNHQIEIDPIEERLNQFAGDIIESRAYNLGYPLNQKSRLISFYKWFMGSGLNLSMVNNAGDPFVTNSQHTKLNMLDFEREALQHMAPLYGFDLDDLWGIITNSGTDGNNHGIYFGSNYLQKKTHQRPIMYASDSAHYSCRRLAHLQNLELKLIPSDIHGSMIPDELEKALVSDRPALVMYAMGTSFKGGSDDIDSLNKVLGKYPDMVCYRHIDAALFGGYIPFSKYRDALNRKYHFFESIAISGHKFFGMNEPAGFFLTTLDVRTKQDTDESGCLNTNMPMISSSRSALTTLKLWWILQKTDIAEFEEQSASMLENAEWLKKEFDKIGLPAWLEPMSNTVYFLRPPKAIAEKYNLAHDRDDRLGGALSHIVVMQHVSKKLLETFLGEVRADLKTRPEYCGEKDGK